MELWQCTQNARDSIKLPLEASIIPAMQTLWNTDKPVEQQISLDFQFRSENPKPPGIWAAVAEEAIYNQAEMREEMIWKIGTVVRADEGLARFLQAQLLERLDIQMGRNDREGFMPFYDYYPDPDNPIQHGMLVLRTLGDMGWEPGPPGESGTPLKDATIIRHHIFIQVSY